MSHTIKVVLPNGKTANATYRSMDSSRAYVRVLEERYDHLVNQYKKTLATVSGKIVSGIGGKLPRFIAADNGKNAYLVGA